MNYEIYYNVLSKESKAFNAHYSKLEIEISNKKKEIHNTEFNEFIKLCGLSIELSNLKNKINKIKHLTADHFVYSSLEAVKNITNEDIKYSWQDDIHMEHEYNFPHNNETNVKYIDERLVDLFESAYNNYINSSMYKSDNQVYKSVTVYY